MENPLRHKYPHHEWTPVTEGDSGAFVFRLTGQQSDLYAKIAPRAPEHPAFDLAGEADRLEWLARHGIPVPRIAERGGNDAFVWTVTEAVPGVSAAEEWPEHQRFAVVEAMARLTRALHELPADRCPFDRSLSVAIAEARRNLREGLVDLDDVGKERKGWSGAQLLAELDRTQPETEDVVVCHGDLCPNNVLLDPVTCEVTGVIDVGRLGLADRHADLALTARELAIDEDPWFGPKYTEQFLGLYDDPGIDKDKMAFYRLLDEFF
ncbi:APH(3')-V family aminoglycoside O-phosphotransferase [Streptomyces sp. NBC_00654]|uniref:APH(3')-V family aminoglycoside O-phosphotransferase n=1 Tax=Streptomyces sp. NBC_00654 TaxID=2975799 RepID=UPI00224EF960|nr:APH(3')-V family aminoglycoside O-phosphotransferase [Streptomyces sp. NBC_00654]MCX4967120.1 APH(3')-V family aminoglycoside O-phosphotransferase [Streptomyces sp. NBC_00654]